MKRCFIGWNKKEEFFPMNKLDNINRKNIKFDLSNVLRYKGKINTLSENWIADNSDYFILQTT
jgi:DNA adenine methylase